MHLKFTSDLKTILEGKRSSCENILVKMRKNSEAYLILYDQMGDKRLVYGEISNKFKNGKEEMKHKEQGIYVGLMGPESVDLPRGKNLIPFHQSRPPHLKLSLSVNFIFFYFQHLSSLLL